MKSWLIEKKGRKATVHSQIEDLKGNVLVQAKYVLHTLPFQMQRCHPMSVFLSITFLLM